MTSPTITDRTEHHRPTSTASRGNESAAAILRGPVSLAEAKATWAHFRFSQSPSIGSELWGGD